jgi:hypothetical protein
VLAYGGGYAIIHNVRRVKEILKYGERQAKPERRDNGRDYDRLPIPKDP